MPICARGVTQPDGTIGLVLDPTAPDLSKCPYVVQSGAEVANSLFSLSAEDGSLISVAIVSTWAVAWMAKALIKVVKGSSE